MDLDKALHGEQIYESEVYVKAGDVFAPGFHISVVDIDLETLTPRVREYVAVDDVGRVVVKEEVEGQVIGGVMQGIAQVLCEWATYDEEGNPTFSSIADAGMPSPEEFTWRVIVDEVEFKSGLLSGTRGVGEAGSIGGLVATFIGLEKAIKDKFGRKVKLQRTPVTPTYLMELLGKS
ncbi:molybdopterin-dependent oxidoreductase [Sulfolobus acidocaldarius DSM 639]|nr:molybdopterin-dependent oxidoreductase [Sulfolobus acidocaldarius DSM 639]